MIMELNQRFKHFNFKEKVLGQYFTPTEVSDFIISLALIHLKNKGSACDPACGDGVFLNSMVKYGFNEIVGVDVDRVCLSMLSGAIKGRVNLYTGDALQRGVDEEGGLNQLKENYFDLVAGNPPFSAKYGRVTDPNILLWYDTGAGRRSQAIEVLFLERFIQLARAGGVIGIILPDGVFLNLNYRKVREFILSKCKVLAVISLPRLIFNSLKRTSSKTSFLFLMKGFRHEGGVFTAQVENLQDLPGILNAYKRHHRSNFSRRVNITADSFLPEKHIISEKLNFKLPTAKLKDLIDGMFCGGTVYGEKRRFSDSGVRFISAKTVTPLGLDFTRESRKYVEPGSLMDKVKARVRVGDVLFVRVGVGCIGRAAVVVDERDLGVADDWIYIIRPRERLSPYYLTVFLQSRYGRLQLEGIKRGVGTVTAPQTLLKEFIIPVPEIRFQESFKEDYLKMVDFRRRGDYTAAEKIFQAMLVKLEEYIKV
ncbi:MAG: N-6 DNA methylase [Candidatus Odinarchaeota archaeon]